MNITNWKRTVLLGFISAIATTIICIAFTYFIESLTNGQNFTGKNELPIINGIPFKAVIISGGIISIILSIISILILRYNAKEFLIVYLAISIVTYIVLLFVVWFIVIGVLGNSTLNSFDYMFYSIFLFPIGAGIGTIISIIISIIINEIRNRIIKLKG